MARDLKNATRLNRYDHQAQRVREGDGVPFTVAKAKLLSHAEFRAAEGNPATPLVGDDRFFDKVAASGRSAALLNLDWMVRNGNNERAKHPPPTGYLVNEVLTSVELGEARMAACIAQQARERRRKLKKDCLTTHRYQIIEFIKQGANRNSNRHYQMVRIAFAHLKARAVMRVYLRTPVGRYLTREREQRRKSRADWGLYSVHFAVRARNLVV